MWDWKKFKEVVNDVISGGAVSAEKAGKELKTAGEERAKAIEEAGQDIKSAKDLYRAGREMAAQTASDKAGIAKKNAKAAAMQSSNSKLMSALQGAEAANTASQEGFDNQINQSASLEAGQEAAKLQNKIQSADAKYNAAADAANATAEAGKRRSNAFTSWLTGATKAGADITKSYLEDK